MSSASSSSSKKSSGKRSKQSSDAAFIDAPAAKRGKKAATKRIKGSPKELAKMLQGISEDTAINADFSGMHMVKQDKWVEFYPLSQRLTAMKLEIDVLGFESLLEEHPDLLKSPPADSKLQKLELSVFLDDECPSEADELADETVTQFMEWYRKTVLAHLRYYPNISELVVSDLALMKKDDAEVAAYCRDHNIKIKTRHRSIPAGRLMEM